MIKTGRFFYSVIVLLFSVLVLALFWLQVIKGQYYRQVAQSNFVRIKRLVATRGEIYDHKYRPIVQNVPSHNLFLDTNQIADLGALSRFLTLHFDIPNEELTALVKKQRFRTYEEILLADNIPYEKMLSVSEYLNYFPELSFRTGSTRSYLYPNHFTGYVGRINEQEYERYHPEDYSINSHIGKTGLERYYEVLLRGKDGQQLMQVDAQGRSLGLFKEEAYNKPLNGLSLVLTIDNDLQEFATKAFGEQHRGALVVMDVKTGGILAYVSKPDYDPNLFMGKISPEVWAELSAPSKPMLDRVIHASYPPGSVFKPITAGLGLQKRLITKETLLSSCVGGFKYGNRFFRCWNASGHGRTNVVQALMQSCDVFFYDLSLRLKLEDFKEYALACGMGAKTGIDLPNERNGFFPDQKWYKETFGKYINVQGHKVNLSIGQGEILTSPIQMCAYFAAIANNGYWIQPHLLKKTVGRSRLTIHQIQPLKRFKLPYEPKDLKTIQEGLYSVCNAPGGTAKVVQVPGATSYGKTGSAENSMGKRTHAWFCGYIETNKPEIAITVFMENAGGGGAMAAPVAKQVFDFYMGNIEEIKKTVQIPEQFITAEDLSEAAEEEDIWQNGESETNIEQPQREQTADDQ